MSSEVCLDMEIRKLRLGELYILSNILSVSDSWKKLMAIVPKQENVPKFNNDHIRQARKYFFYINFHREVYRYIVKNFL